MEDFEEIGHTGGKVKIIVEGDKYAIEFRHSNFNACTFYAIKINMVNHQISYHPMYNASNDESVQEQASVVVLMFSDKQGFFGRICPECEGYFRMKRVGEVSYCPYCGYNGTCAEFFTENQRRYIENYMNLFIRSMAMRASTEIDFDEIINSLPDNHHGFVYSEEHQQNLFECSSCETKFDILGEYGFCPNCKKRNTFAVFTDRMKALEERVIKPVYDESQRSQRDREWEEVLKSTVSEFEALGNDLLSEMEKLPMTPKRRNELKSVSFQRIIKANEKINSYFAIDFMDGIKDVDRDYLNKSFNRRHLLTHKSGIVDEEYLANTGDSSVKLRQKIRVRSNEVKRLIELVGAMGRKLFEGYESIKEL